LYREKGIFFVHLELNLSKKMKKHIPNILSLLNLFAGCIALLFAGSGEFLIAFIFVGIGIFFDFFDGFFARLFKVQGELGKQIDSLADMVTSGVVPGLVMFRMLSEHSEYWIKIYSDNFIIKLLPCFGFIITVSSCLRLAKFNIDAKQTDSFIGLPTPANAIFILSLPLILEYSEFDFVRNIFSNMWFLLLTSILSAYILNSKIKLFSLKIKNISEYKLQILFMVISVVLILVFKFLGIPLLILSYILISIIGKKKHLF